MMIEKNLIAYATIFPVSITIFTMTFGAGNLIYPLFCGASKPALATFFGFLISSTIVPLIGLYLTLEQSGSYNKFLSKWIGFPSAQVISFFAMAMLGPLVCVPRCMLLAKAALEYFTEYSISVFLFSAFFAGVVFILLTLKSGLVKLLGNSLGLINIFLMTIFIIIGLFKGGFKILIQLPINQQFSSFGFGFVSGYKTFDLFAGIFYAHAIFTSTQYFLSKYFSSSRDIDVIKLCKLAAFFSSLYFTLVYLGFFAVAANFSSTLIASDSKSLIFQVSNIIFGRLGSLFACSVVFLSCLCASIGLCVVFVDYIDSIEIVKNNFSYKKILSATCLTAWGISIFGFERIDMAIGSVLTVVYPILFIICILGLIQKVHQKLTCTK